MSRMALSSHLTRRSLLVATAAATAATQIHGPQSTLARSFASRQATPTPASGVWTDAASIPNNVASDASPRFRAVADAVKAAMAANGVPGTALGILMDGDRPVWDVLGVNLRLEMQSGSRGSARGGDRPARNVRDPKSIPVITGR